jgi:hypothetical protein
METITIDPATLRAGAREANRLNRLYSKDFRAYQRAIHNIKTKYELRREAKERELSLQTSSTKLLSPEEIAYRDKQNKTFDELFALSHYTYTKETETTIKEIALLKPQVKRNITKTLKELTALHAQIPKKQTMTQQLVHAKYSYDPLTGELTHNEGTRADKTAVVYASPAKKPNAQNTDRLPLRAKNKLPKHSGWISYTAEQYALLDDDVRAQCTQRFYLERNRDKASIHATLRKTYYIRASVRNPRVHVNTTSYSPQAIIYLYMGAGGRFDYSKGLDNPQRVQEETTREPWGMVNIDARTNRKTAYPCRDGNANNFKWDNIKPSDVDASLITRDPTIPKSYTRTSDSHLPAIYKRRMTYSTERNVRIVGGTYTVHSMGKGNKTTACDTWEDAVTVFNAQLSKLRGHKQRLSNGNIMVTTEICR